VCANWRRVAIAVLVAAVPIAILYRYWLIAPVLQHVSIGQWRFLAVVVAAVCGVLLALLRVPMIALACGALAGLFLGGTWAAFQAPHDVLMTVRDAFLSHLEPFWPTVLLLTVTASVSGFCCSRLARR
jgi:hypothetical protein